MTIHFAAPVLGALVAASLAAADPAPVTQPLLKDGQLVFPPDAEIPRSLTDAERRHLETNPLAATRGTTPPPTGDFRCVAEYEPMDGIIMAWQGSSSWKSILAQMGGQITTTGDAKVYMYVESGGDQTSATSSLIANGADMGRVEFILAPLDTIWCRDYGPRYIYQGDVRAVVDHTYNRPRPNDNLVPADFSDHKHHAYYKLPLVHGGGNYHLEATGFSYATELISNENPGLSDAQIIGYWRDYQNLETTITDALPSFIDSTQHIDMWAIFVSDTDAIVSDWPTQSGTAQDVVCDTWAANLATAGYTVHRVPAVSSGGTHYTFTNAVICNDLVLLPSYTNGAASIYNATALATWQSACPGKTIVQIPSQSIVTAAGVLHCIVMHVPAHLGGENPTAFIQAPAANDVFRPGDPIDVRWLSDDDVLVTRAEIQLSTDGGDNFTVLTNNTPDDGLYTFTAPGVYTTQARVRVVVRDGDGNTGFIDSPDFSIDGGLQLAASNIPALLEPGVVNSFDVTLDPGGEALVPGSPTLYYRYDGGSFLTTPLVHLSGTDYRADLPATDCNATPEFYVAAEGADTGVKTAPVDAPATTYSASMGVLQQVTILDESFEVGLPGGWTASGLWNVTSLCAPAGACDGASWAYYGRTNGCDFDTGTSQGDLSTMVTLPALAGGGAITLTYCSALETEDAGGWDIAQFSAGNGAAVDAPSETLVWEERTVDLTSLAGQTVDLTWSFDTVDAVSNDFRGWLIDHVRIEATEIVCDFTPPTCPGDADGSLTVDFDDLNVILTNWGSAGPDGDLDNSGAVNFDDLNIVLTNWGNTCP